MNLIHDLINQIVRFIHVLPFCVFRLARCQGNKICICINRDNNPKKRFPVVGFICIKSYFLVNIIVKMLQIVHINGVKPKVFVLCFPQNKKRRNSFPLLFL